MENYFGKESSMNYKINLILSSLSATIITLIILLSFQNKFIDGNNSENEFELYNKIDKSGIIRAAYAVGAPLFIIDPNTGEKSGIFFDIVTSLAEKLHLKVNWVTEVGYGEMIQGLRDKRYDIVGSGVWINSDRALGADFSIPLYYDAVFAYAKTGDNRFQKDISILNSPKYIISTMDGELGVSIAKKDFPDAKTLEIPQYSDFTQMILNVISNKADIVFLASAPARSYQIANPDKIVSVRPGNPLRIFPNAIMIPQGQYKFRQILNFTLTEMLNSGEVNAILLKYEKVPNSFLRVSKPFEK